MAAAKHREEHANTLVAQLLRGLGLQVAAETKGRKDGKHPDLIIRSNMADILIEAKYNNRKSAAESADDRLSLSAQNTIAGLEGRFNMPAVIGALSYAPAFEEDPLAAVKSGEIVEFAFKYADDGKGGWDGRWRSGTIYDLAQSLRRPYTVVPGLDDGIKNAVRDIGLVLDDFSRNYSDNSGAQESIAAALQASLPEVRDANKKERKVALEKSMRLAGLILFGAFSFHIALFNRGVGKVKSPLLLGKKPGDIVEHWQYILDEINYASIFRVAITIMKAGAIPASAAMKICQTALHLAGIVRDGVDLMGVIYHELLAELAKPLGAFYTTIPAATMLSSLALAPQQWDKDWAKAKTINDFRIGDLACGTGTLLAAACGQISDNTMRACFDKGEKNPESIKKSAHRALLEKTVWGYDVLETAVHLTATTIGMMAPEVDFRKSHIYRAALGKAVSGDAVYTGSFQLLESDRVTRKFFDPEDAVVHVETGEEVAEPLPLLDLCIMNPPFVVGRKNALSYSFLPPKSAEAVRKEMNRLAKEGDFSNAGLGPGFVTLGEKYVKPGGRMAFILSTTIATGRGKAWQQARAKVEKTCDLELFITSRDPMHSNFSYGTNLQECMFVARKRKDGEKPKERALFAILSQNPQSGEAARAAASAILAAKESNDNWGKLRGLGNQVIGEFARLRYRDCSSWDGVAFANLRLTMAADVFAREGKIPPYSVGESFVPICQLGDMAKFGSYGLHRYIDDPSIEEDIIPRLTLSDTPTSYKGYYPGYHKRQTGIGQKDIADISEKPNCYFMPYPDWEEWADGFFSWGGRVVMNVSFRFNTSRRLVSLISESVQGSNYQPLRLNKYTDKRAKALVLWLNSTIGTMLIATHSVYCQGAKVMLSQKAARDLPVLNLDALSPEQLNALAKVFDKTAKQKLKPLPQMADDKVRIAIDDALAKVLNLKGFKFNDLRRALAAEPIISGG